MKSSPINFDKLLKAKSSSTLSSLTNLFEQLDRKTTHQILRPVQIETLTELDKQLTHHDIVLKVSTGAGKTVVGLVYAEMMRRRYSGEPVLFLCPTKQLVSQVVETAGKIGISAESFQNDTDPYRAFDGRTILVCTYDKVFTARNIFERRDILPSTIVFDDIHSGVEKIRQKYTVRVPTKAYDRIRQIFQPLCEASDPSVWRGIGNNDASARFDVPYWAWIPQASTVSEIIEKLKDEDDVRFSWPNISRYIDQIRLCISGSDAELSLSVPATEENRVCNNAKHRLFMSASIKDGSSLIRDLGCDPGALERVIEPSSDKGSGERMILPISLIDPKLKRSEIAKLCKLLSESVNVVVLTSSVNQAHVWEENGAILITGDGVESSVTTLRNAAFGNFFVFAQRFDGVDLPDDACRVLVIDGIPSGDRLCDQIDIDRQKDSPGYNSRIVNKLEQAFGRAVRSSADFATILLVGNDLAAFIGRKDVKLLLEPHTSAQIDLGKGLADQLCVTEGNSIEIINKVIYLLLDRNNDWKEAHRNCISEIRHDKHTCGLSITERLSFAERQAWLEVKARNHQNGISFLQKLVDEEGIHDVQKAELLAKMAGYMNQFDSGKAATLFRLAFRYNNLLARPPQLPATKYLKVKKQTAEFIEGLRKYSTLSASIAHLEEIRSSLSYAGDYRLVEKGLYDFGKFLGATSSRPEKETGRGPDILWLFDDVAYCIEAKSMNSSSISKSDAEQLLLSKQWCANNTDFDDKSIIPIFATNTKIVDRREDVTYKPMILSEGRLTSLIDSAESLINSLSLDGPLFYDASAINRKLQDYGLVGKFISNGLDYI